MASLPLYSKSLRQSIENMLKGNNGGAGMGVVRDSSDIQAKHCCLSQKGSDGGGPTSRNRANPTTERHDRARLSSSGSTEETTSLI